MRTIIRNATLIDGNGGAPQADAAVIIEDRHVVYAGSASDLSPMENDDIIDAAGRTVMPGLIDAHVHMMFQTAPMTQRLETPFSMRYYQASTYLETTLHAGITSVRDALGSDRGVKQAVEQRLIAGPRIQLSINALTTTGGHGDGYTISGNTIDQVPSGYPGMPDGRCDGVAEVRKRAREMLRAGAEVLKIHATGGVLSATDHPEFTQFSYDELRAAVEEGAFRRGIRVMAHAQGAEGIKNAVRAGVHSIEHGICLDDEAIQLMLDHNTFLVPTLLAPVAVLEMADELGIPQASVDKAREVIEHHRDSIARAYEAGVTIAMGTDAGVFPHGINLRELGLMVDAGMSPMEAIVASTRTAAECLGWQSDVGTLEPGKRADLIIFDGDPLHDIHGLADSARVSLVIKDGMVEKDLIGKRA